MTFRLCLVSCPSCEVTATPGDVNYVFKYFWVYKKKIILFIFEPLTPYLFYYTLLPHVVNKKRGISVLFEIIAPL